LIGGNFNKWEILPITYFQSAISGNSHNDPNDTTTNNTTRGGSGAWTQVYPDEAAFEIVSDTDQKEVDNLKVFSFTSRSNAQDVIVRIDQPYSSNRPLKIEFYASQVHTITKEYVDAFNASEDYTTAYGGDAILPFNQRLFEIPASIGFKSIGGQIRGGTVNLSHGLLIGTLGAASDCGRFYFDDFEIDDDGSDTFGQVGISLLDSISAELMWAWQRVNYVMGGAQSTTIIDQANKISLS
jgi:hypothetical protein